MDYLAHLDTTAFARSARFRVRGEGEDTFLVKTDIERLLRDDYDLTPGETFDVALTADRTTTGWPRMEFGFDAAAVDDPNDVLRDVQSLLDEANDPPDGLSPDRHDEWTPVELTDVSGCIWLAHLNTAAFDQPVRLRVESGTGDAMLPSYELDQLFDETYDLTRGTEWDAALTVDWPRAEFAFDATAVDDVDAVLDDVETLIANFNEFPDDLPEDAREEWEAKNAALTAVSRPDA